MDIGAPIARESQKTNIKLSLSLFVVGSLLNQVAAYFVGKNAIDASEDSPATQFYGNGFFNVPSLVLHGSVLTFILALALTEKYVVAENWSMQDANPAYFNLDPKKVMIRMLAVEIAAIWGVYIASVEIEVSSAFLVVPVSVGFATIGYLLAAKLTGLWRLHDRETLLGDGVGLSDLAEAAPAQVEEDPSRSNNQYKAPDARLFSAAPARPVVDEAKRAEEKRKSAYMSASKQLADAFDAISLVGIECLKNQSTDKMYGKLQRRPQGPDFAYGSSEGSWRRLTTGNLDRRITSESGQKKNPALLENLIAIKEKTEAYNAVFDKFKSTVLGVNHDRDIENYVKARRRSRAEEDAQEQFNRERGVDTAIVNAASIVVNGYSAGSYSNRASF